MSNIYRIRNHVDLSLSTEFLAANESFEFPFDPERDGKVVRDDIDIAALDTLISENESGFAQYDTAMDAALSQKLHKLLPLSRREAADNRLWAWLGLVKYPEYVGWRWKPSSTNSLRSSERFAGSLVRQTFARLWWAAELTVGPESDYSLTDQLFALSGLQDVYEAIFGRAFCQYRPAMAAFVNRVGSKPEAVVRETAKEFGYLLTTDVLEALAEDELAIILTDLSKKVEGVAIAI